MEKFFCCRFHELLKLFHGFTECENFQSAIASINADIEAMEEKVVGLDFKTVTLGAQGDEFLSLVVIATPSRIIVFDLVHSDIILLESGVKEVLESEKVIKVSAFAISSEHWS